MGIPQLENGYTKIANEIIEALAKKRIPGVEMQCVWLIFRKTYGYGKLKDWISNSQFVECTGLKKQHVTRALNSLIGKKIVIKYDDGINPKYRFNKDSSQWILSPKKVTRKILSPKKVTAVTNIGEHSQSPILGNTKETNITKEKTAPPKLLPMEKAKLIFDFQKIVNGSKDHALVMKYTQGNETFEVMQKRIGKELNKLKMEK